MPQMRTIDEIATMFELPRHFVRCAVLDGRVVHVKAGRKYLINVERFTEWLNTGETANYTEPVQLGKVRRIH